MTTSPVIEELLTHESTNPVIAAYVRTLSDRMPEGPRNDLLVPLLPSLLNTAHLDDEKLGWMCAERAIRVFAAAALRAAELPKLINHAEILETVEMGTAAAWAAADAAWAADAADAAADAAWAADAAADARAAAAWAADAAAVAAATAAATDAAWAAACAAAAARAAARADARAAACAAAAGGDWQSAIQLLEDMLAS